MKYEFNCMYGKHKAVIEALTFKAALDQWEANDYKCEACQKKVEVHLCPTCGHEIKSQGTDLTRPIGVSEPERAKSIPEN